MKQANRIMAKLCATVLAASMVSAWGCKDEKSNSGGGADLAEVAESLSSPTGSVTSAETAQGVGEMFAAKLESSSMMGGGESASVPCSTSGDIDVSANSDATEIAYNYNECCETASCCYDGAGWMAQNIGDFAICMAMDVDVSCEGIDGTYKLDYCSGTDGTAWYLVEYESETYACSGYFDSSSGGSWTIKDANGEWNCTATCDGDTCTGSCTDGSDTYEW